MTTADEGDTTSVDPVLPPMGYVARAAAVVITVVALAAVAWVTRGVIVMVIVGFLLAAGLDPLVRRVQRRVRRRGLAVLVVVMALVVGGAVFVTVAVRPAIAQAGEFVADLPEMLDRMSRHFGGSTVADFLASPEVEQQLRSAIDDVVAFAAGSIGAVIGFLASVGGAVFTGFTVAATTVYTMLALPRIKAFAGRAAGDPDQVDMVAEVFRRVGGYVTGQLGICASAGITSAIFFLIIGMPYAALLAMVVAVLDAVPQVGATLAAVVAVLVALTVSVGTAVVVAVFFVAYQQFENFVIAPRVFASAVSLTPMTVYLAVLVGGVLAGFVGAILALPVAATLTVVFRYAFRRSLATMEARAVPEAVAAAPPPPRPARAGRKWRRRRDTES
ncbi:putative PurR-regulated permease PerM [Haloactinopolyspora alba]|uniref:Putative PurR-regulated permease PerM n=1 Tax=Haloactinopolyspora alba TaxID=648780 RepID=A0A2P8E045_9ACTN|nr:AI-2E family transporter [Haloactinopolyspora alba]PSL02819.1 putative PurR-regulated permease PerM [Haloactinopolyspora alba]